MTDPVPSGPELTDAALDRWVADATVMASRYQELQAAVERVSISETTPDGMITVSVNSAGVVTDLRIADRATGVPADRIAAGVLQAMRLAQSRIADRVAEVMRATVGEDNGLEEAVLSPYHKAFPPPPDAVARPAVVEVTPIGGHDEPPSPPPFAPAPPVPASVGRKRRSDDWDDGGSLLEDVDG